MSDAPYPTLADHCLDCLLPYESGERVCARCNTYADDFPDEPARRRRSYLYFLARHGRPTEPTERAAASETDARLLEAWSVARPVAEEFEAYAPYILLPEGWRALKTRTRLQVAYRVAASEKIRARVEARSGAFARAPPGIADLNASAYFTAGLDVAPVLLRLEEARTSAVAQDQLRADFSWGTNTEIDDYAGNEAAVERIAQILSDKSRVAPVDRAAFLPPERAADRPATLRYYLLPGYHLEMLAGIRGQRAEVDEVVFGEILHS